jgi:lysyl-tRNA synthetase class 2
VESSPDQAVEATPAENEQPTRVTEATRSAHNSRSDVAADWFATGALLYSMFLFVVSLVGPFRRYFDRPDEIVSETFLVIDPNIVYATLVLVIAIGLRRRLVQAWWLGLVLILVLPTIGRVLSLALEDASSWGRWVGLVVNTVLIVLFVRAWPQFRARNARGADLRALAVLLVGGLITVLVGGWLAERYGSGGDAGVAAIFGLETILQDIGAITVDQGLTVPFWVRAVVNLLGAAVILGAAYVWFRPPRDSVSLEARDEARVRALLRGFGDLDSLGYFATRRDKSVIWDTDSADDAMAGVSYRVVGSVALASGNPVGDPDRWPTAIEGFRAHARANGWSVAVMAAGEEGAAAYQKAGLDTFQLGDEAILDLTRFTLEGKPMKDVRQAVSRIERRGYTVRAVRHNTLIASDFAALEAAAAVWRGDGGEERGFSMALGRLGDPLDGDCVLVAAYDGQDNVRGFLSFVPWGRNGLSLDLMRRDPTAENGLVEFLVAGLARRAGDLGASRVSLNFAMFREAFERGESLGAGPIARAWRRILMTGNSTWQLESLYRSNAKYAPDWQPRYLCFEYASDLPRVGVAAGNAEGFLAKPSMALALRRGAEEGAGALERSSEVYAAEVAAMMPAEEDPLEAALSTDGLPEQVRIRREKLERIREMGINPYPVNVPYDTPLADVRAQFPDLAPDTRTGTVVSVVGRVMLKRDTGKLCFATLRDGSGDLQVMLSLAEVGEAALDRWKHLIDIGDFVSVTGEVITSRKGELSVAATSWMLSAKSLRPLPDKHKGLTDPEARARMRYVDLIVRPETRSVAYLRSTIVHSVRDSLHRRGFVEVETPMLQVIHGGANARPFVTHINAYNMDVFLRIATELHLKRLLVGGMDKVFEMGRQFRNEGADSSHNPEFTSLEMYQTYSDYQDMRVLTQEIMQEAAVAAFGEPVARRMQPDGSIKEFDLSGEWRHITVIDAVAEKLGEHIHADTPIEEMRAHAARHNIEIEAHWTWGAVLEALYEELCEDSTELPTFYMDFPKEIAPLTKAHRDDPRFAEKWDLVCWGAEQGTAYSELNDPVDQRARFFAQSLLAAAGDLEAMAIDEDFLTALDYGMPPTGGQGMGIDRLVMTLTGLSIRDTILFPMVKPQ